MLRYGRNVFKWQAGVFSLVICKLKYTVDGRNVALMAKQLAECFCQSCWSPVQVMLDQVASYFSALISLLEGTLRSPFKVNEKTETNRHGGSDAPSLAILLHREL